MRVWRGHVGGRRGYAVAVCAAALLVLGAPPGAGAPPGTSTASGTGTASAASGAALTKERLYALARARTYGTPVRLDVPGQVSSTQLTDSGHVVGSTYVDDVMQLFRWHDGRAELLAAQDADITQLVDANDAGQILAFRRWWTGPWNEVDAFLWEPSGAVVSLGTWASVVAVDDDGRVVGTLPGGQLATWRDGVVTPVAAPPGQVALPWGGHATNDRGDIAGTVVTGTTSRGWVWRDGVATELPSPAGADVYVQWITDSGHVLGEVDGVTVLWEHGQRLRDVDPQDRYQLAVGDVNARGVVVGTAQRYHLRGPVRSNERGVAMPLPGLGGPGGTASGIHDLDIAVGTAYRAGGGWTQPVMWVLTVPVALGTRLDGVQARGGGASDINERGQVLGRLEMPVGSAVPGGLVMWDLRAG